MPRSEGPPNRQEWTARHPRCARHRAARPPAGHGWACL